MSRWQALKWLYRQDRVGFVILCCAFGVVSVMAGGCLYIGWTTGDWMAVAFGSVVAATTVWLLHIATTP